MPHLSRLVETQGSEAHVPVPRLANRRKVAHSEILFMLPHSAGFEACLLQNHPCFKFSRLANHPFTNVIIVSGYLAPEAALFGATSLIRRKSSEVSFTPSAPAFSSRYLRRFVPGMGIMSLPCASSHASASCPGVQFLSFAIDSTRVTRSKFF